MVLVFDIESYITLFYISAFQLVRLTERNGHGLPSVLVASSLVKRMLANLLLA